MRGFREPAPTPGLRLLPDEISARLLGSCELNDPELTIADLVRELLLEI